MAAVVCLLGGVAWFGVSQRRDSGSAAGGTLAQATPPPAVAPAAPPERPPLIAAAPPPRQPASAGPPPATATPPTPTLPRNDQLTAAAPPPTRGSGPFVGSSAPRTFGYNTSRPPANASEPEALRSAREQIERTPGLSPAQRTRVTADLARGRGLREVAAVSFAGKTTRPATNEISLLLAALSPGRPDPPAAIVVLGYANSGRSPAQNLSRSRQQAEAVAAQLRKRLGNSTPVYAIGLGSGSGLLENRRDSASAGAGFAEVWTVQP